jgi:ATP-dependent DNA helicase RecG
MDKNKFSDINTLIDKIHNPKSFKDISECRRRKKYEEILEFFIRVNYFKSLKEKSVREPIKYDIEEVKRFISTIPFELTSDQKLVCNEIFRDFKTNHPLNRLVQGDVGSGKTIVALIAAYAMVTAKKQVVLMAPTEILAKQHYEYFKRFLVPFNVNVGLLTGATSKANRNILLQDIRTGNLDIIIGTHALFYEEIEYKKLGLAIIDEQHRFGVKARNSLLGERVIDALYLSATPIPRTLGLTLFGDLNISSIKTARVDKKRITTEIVSIKDEITFKAFDAVILPDMLQQEF